jgi:hypothetical protein
MGPLILKRSSSPISAAGHYLVATKLPEGAIGFDA